MFELRKIEKRINEIKQRDIEKYSAGTCNYDPVSQQQSELDALKTKR